MAAMRIDKQNVPLSRNSLFCNKSGHVGFRVEEAYKSIRTALQFSLSANRDNAVVVTSAEPNAGKSVTSANLALSISQSNLKVLLVDCDMRNPSQHKVFEKVNSVGLSNVLAGMVDFSVAVHRRVYDDLDLLTAGTLPPNPSELLASESFKELIKGLQKSYDYVILDSPPVGVVSDALSILLNIPQVIVVARQGKTCYPEVLKTIDAICKVGGKILGSVITDSGSEKAGYGHYRSNGDYGKYGRYGNYGSYGRYGSKDTLTNSIPQSAVFAESIDNHQDKVETDNIANTYGAYDEVSVSSDDKRKNLKPRRKA